MDAAISPFFDVIHPYILKNGDLNSLTARIVRKQLEEKFQEDLKERKKEIDAVLMELIDAAENSSSNKKTTEVNNSSDCKSEDEAEEPPGDLPEFGNRIITHPFKELICNAYIVVKILLHLNENKSQGPDKMHPKVLKEFNQKIYAHLYQKYSTNPYAKKSDDAKEHTIEEEKVKKADSDASSDEFDIDHEIISDLKIDDEALARKLQDEERKTRSTRQKRKAPTKKEKKDTKDTAPKKKRETAYSRKCLLSPDLAAIVGSSEMARSEVVKKMWEVVRERNLFFPKNKQFALCDEQFLKVFGMYLHLDYFHIYKLFIEID
ncbi:Upstream activation factor subunit UAF30 [Nymphon striatum]|nr:Upstream activation factor subunit UAF30 [Nymphon striatum]